jgi:hypothetical protein
MGDTGTDMSHPTHAPTEEETLAAGHELSDASAAPILRFLVFLTVLTVATMGIIALFYNFLERREAAEKTALYPLAVGQVRPLPPPPRLQTYPFRDLRDLRREEDRLLTTYEWVNKNAGTVRLPIARAMEVVAAQGLPYRHDGTTPAPPAAVAPK